MLPIDVHRYELTCIHHHVNVFQTNNSAWSRADAPIYIGDMNKEESLRFVMDKRKLNSDRSDPNGEEIDQETAEQVYYHVLN